MSEPATSNLSATPRFEYKYLKVYTNKLCVVIFVSYPMVSFRPTKKMQKEFEEMAQEEDIDRSEAARTVFEAGLSEWKKTRALRLFEKGKISILKAAELADLSIYEFLELLSQRKIAFVEIGEDDLEREAKKAGE